MKLVEYIIFFVAVLLALFAGGCGSSPDAVELPSASPQASLDNAGAATTQASAGNAGSIVAVQKSAVALGAATAEQAKQAQAIRVEYPPAAPRADSILSEVAKIIGVKGALEATAVRMAETQTRIGDIAAAVAAAKRIDAEQDAQFKLLLEKQAEATEKEKKRADDATAELKESTKARLLFVVVPCLIGIGVGLFLIFSPLKMYGWGSALCIASGGVLVASLLLSALVPFLPWIIGALLVGGGGLLAYKLLVKNRAVKDTVQTVETLRETVKVVAPDKAPMIDIAMFGMKGVTETQYADTTTAEVRKLRKSGTIRKSPAIVPAVVPQTPGVP